MSGIEGDVLNSAITSGFGGILAYVVIKKLDEFRRETVTEIKETREKVMREIDRMKETIYILIDAQTDEIKKKSGMHSNAQENDAIRRTIRR